MSPRAMLAGAVGAVLLAGAGIAVALVLSSGGPAPGRTVAGAATVNALLEGIPQNGVRLGSAAAPVTLVEFADLQCPFCARWMRTELPWIVRSFVRTGLVQVLYGGMAFIGRDSQRALRAALAAGHEGRLWNVVELLFANQGPENGGWVTSSLLRSIGEAVPGLDTTRMLADRSSARVSQELARSVAVASAAGVHATPTLAVGRTGGTLTIVDPARLEAAVRAALAS